jgi:hypothetical protein
MAATLDAGPSASLAMEKTHRVCQTFSQIYGRTNGLPHRAAWSYVTVLEWFGTDPTGCYIIPLCHFSRLRF